MTSYKYLIKRTFYKDIPHINIIPVGDVHIGSKEANIECFKKKINIVKNDPNSYMVICGDALDMGIVGSKTSVYDENMTPQEAKELLYQLLLPIKDKILAVVPGNHEDRMVKAVGINPLYDICCRLQIEDLYREEMAGIQIMFKDTDKGRHNVTYCGIISHGRSNAKHQKFALSFDGADFFISGHTHTPSYTPKGKLRFDIYHGVLAQVGYKEIVVDSMLDYGGYGAKKEYLPTPPHELQILTLSSKKRQITYTAKDI